VVDLRQLRHFVMVCEELHFRRAAERLGMSQPPLTQSIQAMERALGVELLHRSRRGVQVTRLGALVLAEARATLAQADQMMTVADRARRGQIGSLRVAFSISAPFARPFTRALQVFRKRYPNVTLDLQRTSGIRWIGMLERDEVDICVTRPLHPINLPDGLSHMVVQRDRLMLLLPIDHQAAQKPRIALSEVAKEPFILHPRGEGTAVYRQVMNLWTQSGMMPKITKEYGDAATMMGVVASGGGVTILPSMLRMIHHEDIAWRDIDADPALTESAVVVVLAEQRRKEMPHAAFLELIQEAAAKHGERVS
jgi:DNA-binding transcriptional LysR family regulator